MRALSFEELKLLLQMLGPVARSMGRVTSAPGDNAASCSAVSRVSAATASLPLGEAIAAGAAQRTPARGEEAGHQPA